MVIGVHVDSAVEQQLDRLAQQHGKSRCACLREAISQYLLRYGDSGDARRQSQLLAAQEAPHWSDWTADAAGLAARHDGDRGQPRRLLRQAEAPVGGAAGRPLSLEDLRPPLEVLCRGVVAGAPGTPGAALTRTAVLPLTPTDPWDGLEAELPWSSSAGPWDVPLPIVEVLQLLAILPSLPLPAGQTMDL